MKKQSLIILLVFQALFNLNPSVSYAHNGERAIALPLSDIIIDGNITDWPSDINKYPVNRNNSEDEEDFRAYFRIGYNLQEQSLYILMEVQDDEHVLSTKFNSKPMEQDAHWLFLDLKHERKGSGIDFYALSENSMRILFNEDSWDYDTREHNINGVTHAVQRKGNMTFYEWKIFLGEELYVNRTIGLDHEIVDVDADGSSIKSWGLFGMKTSVSNNLGDVFILEKINEELSTLNGIAQLEQPYSHVVPYGLELVNLDYPNMWTQFPLLRNKEYEIELPPGRYSINSALIGNVTSEDLMLSSRSDEGIEVLIKKGQRATAPIYHVKAQEAPSFFAGKSGILRNFNQEDTLQIDKFFVKVLDFYSIPGMSMALIKDGKIVYSKNYGESNAYENTEVSDKAVFDAGSVTKPVFAFLVMKMVEQGVIELDRPLYQYLPYEDIAHDTAYHKLTARFVLSHRTGFPNWRNGQLNFINPPGTFGYSGEGFVYLSKVIEEITQTDIESLLMRYVIDTLEIKNTHFSNHPELKDKLVHGHDDKYSNLLMPSETPNMAYTMHTNAREFSKFIIALMDRNLLSKETYNEMFSKQVDLPANWSEANTDWKQGFGLGFQLKYSPFGFAYGHSGRNGGYDCSFEVYEDEGIAYVFFTNSSNGYRIKNVIREFLIIGQNK